MSWVCPRRRKVLTILLCWTIQSTLVIYWGPMFRAEPSRSLFSGWNQEVITASSNGLQSNSGFRTGPFLTSCAMRVHRQICWNIAGRGLKCSPGAGGNAKSRWRVTPSPGKCKSISTNLKMLLRLSACGPMRTWKIFC